MDSSRRFSAGAGLLLLIAGLSLVPNCGAASPFGRGLRQQTGATAAGGINLQALLSNLQSYSLQNLLSNSVAKAASDPATPAGGAGLVNAISTNFQSLVNDQAKYFQNLQSNLAMGNGTNAQRVVCDFYNLYQANMGANAAMTQLFGPSSPLGRLLANRTFADQFRNECKQVGNTASANGTLAAAVNALLADTPTAQLVQSLNNLGGGTAATGTKPMQQSSSLLSGVTSGPVASYLTAITNQVMGGAGSGAAGASTLMSQLFNTFVDLLGSSASAATGALSGTGAGAVTDAFLKGLQGAAAAGSGTGAGAAATESRLGSLLGGGGGAGGGQLLDTLSKLGGRKQA